MNDRVRDQIVQQLIAWYEPYTTDQAVDPLSQKLSERSVFIAGRIADNVVASIPELREDFIYLSAYEQLQQSSTAWEARARAAEEALSTIEPLIKGDARSQVADVLDKASNIGKDPRVDPRVDPIIVDPPSPADKA